mgnify:CR=1 FL=1
MTGFVFKRYELKYLLTTNQYFTVKREILKRLTPDKFGENTVQSLYYDTPDNRLVRESIEKPIFKEKLRLRCYNLNDDDRDIYVEMKRKYDGIVYKRRIACKESEAKNLFDGKLLQSTQIGKELGYFLSFYQDLQPKTLILYDREAFFDKTSDLRVTFDKNVRYRNDDLNFYTSLCGKPLLSDGLVLMELKTGTALPLWLCDLLDKENIRKTSFSKYGTAYRLEFEKIIRIQSIRSTLLCLNRFSTTETSPLSASSSL